MRPDIAATDALADSLARLLPALESFTRFEGADPAARRTLWRAALDEPLPETGAGREAVLETLRSHVIVNGLRIGAPGFSGWVTTMPTTVPAVAQLAGAIAAAQRWWATPGNFLEVLALRWLQRLVGLPDHFEGGFTSGGATANLVGLAAARQHAGEKRGFDPSLDGLQRLVEPRVYASTEVHHVVHRACGVLGLGRRALRMIPVDAKRTPDLSALERFLDEDLAAGRTPVAVVASAGDVNTGAVEPIDAMRGIAHARGVWLHVDGAYGGFAALAPSARPLFRGIEQADSVALDPHKWLYLSMGCGCVLYRDAAAASRAFAHKAEYTRPVGLEAEEAFVFWDFGPELSRRFRALAVWFQIKCAGVQALGAAVERNIAYARHLEKLVTASTDFELLAPVPLSIVCFRYKPPGLTCDLDAFNERVLVELQRQGHSYVSNARLKGRFALRACVLNHRTTEQDMETLLEDVRRAAVAVLEA
jgi:aromatic-L-amino-acid/L-tryptophan decarboxylase